MMKPAKRLQPWCRNGFTLPVVLVIASALLVLAIGLLLHVSIERKTARSYLDHQRAEFTSRAGLMEVVSLLRTETANDDFLVIKSALKDSNEIGKTPAPALFLVRGKAVPGGLSFRYLPLFSAASAPVDTPRLSVPPVEPLVPRDNGTTTEMATLPYLDKALLTWVPVKDHKGQLIGRYAFWVEDLQSRVDANTAGNTKDIGGAHKRYGWIAGDPSPYPKFPAPGLNPAPSNLGDDGRDKEPPLDQVALYTVDPAVTTAKDTSALDKTIIDDRMALISPDSTLAAAGIKPPLTRDTAGHLVDPTARAVEENLSAALQPYDEQPVVPFADGLSPKALGKPKLNLNALLAKNPDSAVDEMAEWIDTALPNFKDRKGGFPQDYLKTIAANAIDYADSDSEATVSVQKRASESYRGLDAYPLLSEIILHVKYLGIQKTNGRNIMLWQMIVFVELWNHTNQLVIGTANVSYENKLRIPAFGAGISEFFDNDALLQDPDQFKAIPQLIRKGSTYWSGPLTLPNTSEVRLEPNQFQFYRAITMDYALDLSPDTVSYHSGNTFNIDELKAGESGMSLMWNDRIVDRSDKLFRGNADINQHEFDFKIGTHKQIGQAQIPGHSYGIPQRNDFKNCMGDSRQSIYLLGDSDFPISSNFYPGNVSPNRRNIRNFTIYKNGLGQSHVFGRVQPSEWPDGGHDSAVPISALPILSYAQNYAAVHHYDPADLSIYPQVINSVEGDAPTYISNRGRFYSATELGRIYDPIMYVPKYDNADDTSKILIGEMPPGQSLWPSVEVGSEPSIYYGGGNTLRIGRPEHPLFDQPKTHAPQLMPNDHAARLLDLFHVGKSRAESKIDREGPVVRIEGHMNLNTASRDAIRAMVGGVLVADPKLSKQISDVHSFLTMAVPISPLEVSVPTKKLQGDEVADAIIRGRPYTSPSEVACVLDDQGRAIFGDRELLPDAKKIQWTDAAAEEAFARVYEASTVRSRNFRVWVIGQTLSPTSVTNPKPEVLAEVRKAFSIFADPGDRRNDGSINSTEYQIKIINETDF
jgi:hypothetical protein